MTPRIPSRSQIRGQIRRDQRQAERKLQGVLNQAQRRAESEVNRQADKALQQWNADVKGEARKVERRSRPSVTYTPAERRYLDSVQTSVKRIEDRQGDLRDVFLCHAWDDRTAAALELHDALEAYDVDVWFSEKDVALGVPLTRELDRGLRNSKTGLVLVTPAMLTTLKDQGIADKELSALLATDRVIPVVHGTTFEDLRNESPLLASRSGLSTEGSSLEEVAAKIAETLKKPAS